MCNIEEQFPIFGAKYNFNLEGVVDCPEFLVYFPVLVKSVNLYILLIYSLYFYIIYIFYFQPSEKLWIGTENEYEI